ncbi:hypothetical protein [Parashewanella tropica]|uniref:hypothetical protein n=1 Tax=Parashewanella tropica TaxID=2547970 RepID=UPI001059B364|nr:hypothetical protein [Parashewanella tropica]
MLAAEHKQDAACQILLRNWYKEHGNIQCITPAAIQAKEKFESLLKQREMGNSLACYLANKKEAGAPQLQKKPMS